MSRQLSFAEFDAPPADRLLFAIFPDTATVERLADLAQRLHRECGLTGKILARDRFHVTVNHIDDFAGLPRDIVAKAREAGANVRAAPFDVAFDRVESFKSARGDLPLVLRGGDGLASLIAFQKTLHEQMRRAGLGRWVESHYTPHVTLLYEKRAVAGRAVEPISWTVHELVLLHSKLGQTQHTPLSRWPLLG